MTIISIQNIFRFLVFLTIWTFNSNLSQCQDYTAGDIITLQVNDFSLIETNHAPISMNLTAAIPGQPVQAVSNSDMFIKVSSIVPGGTNREITARIAAGTVPLGTKLTLQSAESTTTNSGGRLGIPVATPLILSEIDQDLVYLLGSCYTGTGYNDGYQLTFTWGPDGPETNYHLIEATEDPVNLTIVFTITAHDGN